MFKNIGFIVRVWKASREGMTTTEKAVGYSYRLQEDYTPPQRQRWWGAHWEILALVRKQRKRGKLWARVFLVISVEGLDEARLTGLKLASLNHLSGHSGA